MSWTALMLVGALALAGQDGATTSGDTGPVVDLGEVRVDATLEQRATEFVRQAAEPPRNRRMARWNQDICIRVANMDARYAQFMIDRISLMAAGLGLRPGEPGCRPNIIIAATDDGPVMATALANEMESDMRPVLGVSDKGRAAFQSFQTSDAPVRWWHVSLPYEVDTGAIALGMVGVRQVSRIRATTREDLAWVSIILDVEKIGKVPFAALSDYVGMVVLTQADSDADMTDYDTILNLFATDQRSAVMSRWDRDYLAALYTARRDRLRQSSLNRDVASRLVERQRRPQPEPVMDRP